MQSFKPGILAYLKIAANLNECPTKYRSKIEDIIDKEAAAATTQTWSKVETYYLLVYCKQEIWRDINYVNVAIKMNLKLPEISLLRSAGFFTADICKNRVKEVLDSFASQVTNFNEKDIDDQLTFAIQYIKEKDSRERNAFCSDSRNKEYIQMFINNKTIKPEDRQKVAQAAKIYYSFIPEYLCTESIGRNRQFKQLEENLNNLPIDLNTSHSGGGNISAPIYSRPPVVIRSCEATSLSPRSASVSPPVENDPIEKSIPSISQPSIPIPPLKKNHSGAEISLPTPEPMDYEDSKPSIATTKQQQQQVTQEEPKRVSNRPRLSETSPTKKVIPPPPSFKETSVEIKPSTTTAINLPPPEGLPSSSPPKKRKSQTPRNSESSNNAVIKETTPNSPMTHQQQQKNRPTPLKTDLPMPIRDRRRKTQVYTPPTSPAPKIPHIEHSEDLGIKDEIVLSSDVSRASSRLSSSVQASALSSAVPSARSSEERSKTDSRQSQHIPAIIPRPPMTKIKHSQTILSIASKIAKKSTTTTNNKRSSNSNVVPFQIKRASTTTTTMTTSKNEKYDIGCQTKTPFNVANEITLTYDSANPMPEALVKALNEPKKPFTRKQAIALNLNLDRKSLNEVYPNLTSSKYFKLQKAINNLDKNGILQNPECFTNRKYSKIVKKPMDSHTITNLISKTNTTNNNMELDELEMLWALAAANKAAVVGVSKSDKNEKNKTKELLYQSTEYFQKTRALEKDGNNF